MHPDEVRRRFRELFRLHVIRGEVRSLSQYQAWFAGNDELVTAEFERVETGATDFESLSGSSLVENAKAASQDGVTRTLGRLVPDARERYRNSGEIGRGAMGAVLRIFDDSLERSLAMKVIRDDVDIFRSDASRMNRGPQLVRRFVEEARITAQLDHPGVVPVHDFGIDEHGNLYFTMKLVEGRGLDEVFRLVRAGAEAWTLTRVVQVFTRICETLAFAHSRGVIHRDVKPANMMIGSYGEVYVMDWGLAKRLKRGGSQEDREAAELTPAPGPGSMNATRMGAVMGSPPYMAPEQARGQHYDIGPHTDVYAIGAMLYQLLTGHAPYTHPGGGTTSKEVVQMIQEGPPVPLAEFAPEAPPELVSIIEKAMARRMAHRYQTAMALGGDLQNYLEGRVVTAHRTGTHVEVTKWLKRNRRFVLTAATAVLIGIAGMIAYAVQELRTVEVAEHAAEAADKAARISRQAAAKEKEAAGRERGARERADGQRLAALAHGFVDDHPTRALLVAIEAYERAPGPEARTALYAAVAKHRETALLSGHDAALTDAFFSADGRRVVTVAREPLVLLWDAATGALVQRFHSAGAEVAHAAVDSESGRLVTVPERGPWQIWDVQAGTEVSRRDVPSMEVLEIRYSTDGNTIEVAESDGTVIVLDAESLAERVRFWKHAGGLRNVSPDKSRQGYWSVAIDGSVRSIDAESGKQRSTAIPPEMPGEGPVRTWISRDGQRAVSERSGCVAWDVRTGTVLWRRDGLDVLAVSADCDRVIARAPGDVQLELLGEDGQRANRCMLPVGPHTYRFGPSGDRVIAQGRDRAAMSFWDVRTPAGFEPLVGHRHSVVHARFSPDGRRIVSASEDRTARIWTLEFPGDRLGLDASRGGRCLAVSPDGNAAVVSLPGRTRSAAARIAVLGTAQGRTLLDLGADETAPGPSPRFAGANRIVSVCRDGKVRVWDLRAGSVVATMSAPGDDTPRIELSADGSQVLIHGSGSTFVVHAVESASEVARFDAGDSPVTGVALSPQADRVAVVEGAHALVQVHDLKTGKRLCTLVGHTAQVHAAAFSRDGERIATTSMDGSMRLWDAATGAPIHVSSGLPAVTERVVFSPRGDLMAVVSAEGVYHFDAREGGLRAKIPGSFPGAQFSPDGNFLVSFQGRGLVRRWPVDVERFARQRRPRDLSPDERLQYGIGTPEEALAAWEGWAANHPSLGNHFLWGDAALAAGDMAQAERAARRIGSLRPDHPLGPLAMARYHGARALAAKDSPALATQRTESLEQGIASFSRAIDLGLRDRFRHERDPHLAGLADDGRFQGLLDGIPLRR